VEGYPQILRTERHVVAAAGHHQLALRILEQQAGAAVHVKRAFGGPAVRGEQPRERGEQGALAGTRRSQQEHPFTAFDAQVDPAQRPGPAAGVAPTEPG
jgi:hypothetical protein